MNNQLSDKDLKELKELCNRYNVEYDLIEKLLNLEIESRYTRTDRMFNKDLILLIEEYLNESGDNHDIERDNT